MTKLFLDKWRIIKVKSNQSFPIWVYISVIWLNGITRSHVMCRYCGTNDKMKKGLESPSFILLNFFPYFTLTWSFFLSFLSLETICICALPYGIFYVNTHWHWKYSHSPNHQHTWDMFSGKFTGCNISLLI